MNATPPSAAPDSSGRTDLPGVQPPLTAAQRVKQYVVFVVKLGIAVGLLIWVFKTKVTPEGYAKLKELFNSPLILSAAIAAFSVQLVIGAQRLRILLAPQQVHLSYWTALRLTYLGAFFDTFMITSVGGDAIKAIYLAREAPRERRVEAVSVLILDRLMGLIGLLALALTVATMQYQRLQSNPETALVIKFLVGVPLALLIGTMMLLSETVYTSQPMQWLLRILPFGTTLNRAYGSLQKFRDRPGVLLRAFLMSLIVHFFGVLTGYILIFGINPHTEMGPFFVSLLICNFVVSFAPFAGIGVAQAVYFPIFKMIAGIEDGPVLATVMQAAILVAKAPGFVAWLLSREAVKHPAAPVSVQEPSVANQAVKEGVGTT